MKKALFYILSFTWGLPMTLLGAIIGAILICFGIEPKLYNGYIRFEFGKRWGGLSCGIFIFTDPNPSKDTLKHEAGHGIQNIVFGIAFPIIIGIPSLIRCQYYNYLSSHDWEKYKKLPDYDSIWFEAQASKWGAKYIK